MENLRNPMMHLGSEHAWARERDGVQFFTDRERNYFVYYVPSEDVFFSDYSFLYESKTTIYMTQRDAETYADKMNKGLIAFPYEVE